MKQRAIVMKTAVTKQYSDYNDNWRDRAIPWKWNTLKLFITSAITGALLLLGFSTPASSETARLITFDSNQGISALSAGTLISQHNLQLVSMRHEQDFVGEYFFDATLSPSQAIDDYLSTTEADFHTQPRVVEVVAMGSLSETEELAIQVELNQLAAFVPIPTSGIPVPPAAPSRSRAVSASSPAWAPDFVAGDAYESGGLAKFRSVLRWTTQYHSPDFTEPDWGFEYDWSLFNSALTGERRLICSADSLNDDKFWASRAPTEIRAWNVWVNGTSLTGSDNYGVYLDNNDELDPCSRLGFAIGIGYPRNLPAHPEVVVLITANRGTKASSPYAAYLQLSSNDCPFSPNTNCMGLNDKRQLSTGGTKNFEAIPQSFLWSAPGCFQFHSGTSRSRTCL